MAIRLKSVPSMIKAPKIFPSVVYKNDRLKF
jgi:hypothetical protein